MTCLRRLLVVWVLLAIAVIPCHGQDPTPGHTQPPASGVQDESGFFGKDSGTVQRISELFRRLDQERGYKIFLVVEPVLIAGSAVERASDLRQQWVPEGDGLVIVFESDMFKSDSKGLGIGRDMSARPGEQEAKVRVPTHETNAILSRALEGVDNQLAAEPYLEAFSGRLVSEFEDYFKRMAAPPPPERSMKIGLLVVGTISVLGLGAIAAGSLVRHSGIAGTRRFMFPVVEAPERLGAPCGASVTTRRFSSPAAQG